MRQVLAQPVVIENKPGAFGILAIEDMARARPDGYTLQVGNPGTNALAPIIYKKKFKIDYEKDVTLITRLSEVPLVLAVTTKDFGPKTYAEFIAYAKANPGKVRYASVGIGSNNHYDTDGALSLFTMLQPAISIRHRDLMLRAARSGDVELALRTAHARLTFTIAPEMRVLQSTHG